MPSVKLSVTVRGLLERKYDAAALKTIDRAVKGWIAADANRGFRTIHVALDDAAAMKALGVPAVKGKATAGKVKRTIDALWARLTPDYLVLFGGQDIVPSFVVANPSYDPAGDDDKAVPTDNPYASSSPFRAKTRASYLVPDRVVGRIPDMLVDGDPAWLLEYLSTAAGSTPGEASVYRDAYAICCDTWKHAGAACVEYLGKPASLLLVSPPEADSSATAKKRLSSRLHMIKCHGSPLDPQFYGQKGNAYPVALFSATLKPRLKPGTLVAAMCCYGAQVYSPSDPAATVPGEWPLASTYLRKGAPGFAGSTMIAWVGVSEMMCADWIVAGYLKGVLGGASIGRAFLEAKQDYVRWINQQGHAPDLADEKTLIEFVLLGDPSIHPVSAAVPAAAARTPAHTLAARPSPLALQERRQRRIVRARMAEQIREVLPVRTAASGALKARAAKLFEAARAALKVDPKTFGIRPKAARVERLETRLPAPPAAARRGPAMAKARPAGNRESIEYYWSGRRVQDGHKQIRLVKVETDPKGNVLRTAVIHSS
jgi:Peptidase family C25